MLADFVSGGDVLVLDTSAQVVFTYPNRSQLLGQIHAAQPYFQTITAAVSGPTFFNVVTDQQTERKVVGLATPLINDDGRLSGVLVGRFYLDNQHFGRYLRPLQAGDQGQVYLVDQRGQVIFHSQSDQIGQDFSDQVAVLNLQRRNQPGAYTQPGLDAVREVFGYAPVERAGWGLVMATPWDQIVQPVQMALVLISSALVLGLVGLILVVFWAVRRINQPLERLVHQTRQVAAGMYDSQVSLSRIAEIRELGLAFNHMVSQLESYRNGLQEYVASVTDTQEEERKRIARDLHDGTVQTLIAVGQRIELARDTLAEYPLEQSRVQLNELRTMVTDAIASIRQFSRDLRPLALEDLGLIPALNVLISRLAQEEGISTDLVIEGEAVGLSPDLETAIYRLLQEALNNIRKHAQAGQVLVTIRFLPRQTIVEVQDDGLGFSVPATTTDLARNGSFGLLGMEERAHLFGGDISIQSAIGQGSIIRVILPHTQMPRRRMSD